MTPAPRNTKVLVADSDRAVLEMLQIRLDLAGYHALAARSAPAALEIIRNMGPAVLVLDLALPETDAFDLLTILQRDRSRPMCPTLLIGKRLGIEEIKRAATFGVRACMVKPFSGADLLERVAKVLKPPQPQPSRPPGAGHVPHQSGTGPQVSKSGDFFL